MEKWPLSINYLLDVKFSQCNHMNNQISFGRYRSDLINGVQSTVVKVGNSCEIVVFSQVSPARGLVLLHKKSNTFLRNF